MSAITKMRHLSKWIFIIVAIVFIGGFLMGELWQILGRRTGKNMLEKGIVGKVGKKHISLQEYRNVFEYFTVKYQTEKKIRNLSPQDYENINQQTWQYLTQQKIWDDIYKKGKIKITDAEIIEIMKANPPENIRNDPQFKTADGNFDYEKYQNYLFAPENRLYTQLYARELADGLPKEKFRLDVLNSYRVTNNEVEEALKRENTGIKLTYLYFGSRVLKERYQPTDAEIKEYYNKHKKDKYQQKEMYRVRYVFFYKTISQRDSLDAQRQIEDAYALSKTDEFNNLIRDFSDNPHDSAAQWVNFKDLDSITRSAISNLKNDSITPPFLNFLGWQIIKVDQRKKDSLLIRKIVKSIKVTQESEDALKDSVNNFVTQARSVDFDTVCAQYGLMPREMAPMTKERISFPALFNQNQLKAFVLSAKPKSVSQPMKARNGYYVFQLISAEPQKVQTLEQVKVSIEWEIRRNKEKEL
ncbi:MAG: SurA N-terminal domain-containing protein, partial [candidate division WOR-3 bacterium]|nr:SurA N-terminal domain-containing protein [candidate division WOR-3 bacterium]